MALVRYLLYQLNRHNNYWSVIRFGFKLTRISPAQYRTSILLRSLLIALFWFLLAVIAVQLAIQKIGHQPWFGKLATFLRLVKPRTMAINQRSI